MAFGAAVVIAFVANVLQFGFLFSPKLLAPKFCKLNPIAGLQADLSSRRRRWCSSRSSS